ncbi:hypothetical protein [Planctomycetes bacterium CA13]|uniref:hypothetical protein n=1 Tax=Novipirellula herctigrandis TaxID=2527986 RepID=UPI0011B7E5B4
MGIKKILQTTVFVLSMFAGFPAFSKQSTHAVGLFRNEVGAVQGYTLFAPRPNKTFPNAHWVPSPRNDAEKVMVLYRNYRSDHSTFKGGDIPITKNGTFDWAKHAISKPICEPFHAGNMASGNRLPNGNTLLFESVKGRIQRLTPAPEMVWKYVVPVERSGPMVQGETIPVDFDGDHLTPICLAYRYAADYPGLQGNELISNDVIEKQVRFVSLQGESPTRGEA